MDRLSTLLHDYSIPTHLSCLSQMVPVKSEHICIFVCYSATCPLILLHSGRRRGDFLGAVPPLSLAPVSAPPPKRHRRSHGRAVPSGCPGGLPGCLEGSHTPGQQHGSDSWHRDSCFPGCWGMFPVLSVMRAIKKVQVLKRS